MKRGLVISGGGVKGSFAGGCVEYLMKEKNMDWDVLVGTSTGALLIPLISLGKIDELKDKYTNVTNSDIFSVVPYNSKGKLKVFNAIKRIILGKTSLGDASNLLKEIKKILTVKDYYSLNSKDVFITVSNMTKSIVEYKKLGRETYFDFCEWMLASASVPIAFDIVVKNECEYLDGGILEPIPVQKAIDEKCDVIDIFILSSEYREDTKKSKNIFDIASKTISLMNFEINNNDISISKLEGTQRNIQLNIYRIPYIPNLNSLNFNKKEMTKLWKDGYEFAKNNAPICNILEKTKKGYRLK